MRRLYTFTLAVVAVSFAFAPAVVAPPAAQASQANDVWLDSRFCYDQDRVGVSFNGIILDRDNTGYGMEKIVISVHDGTGAVSPFLSQSFPLGNLGPLSAGNLPIRPKVTENPITTTVVSAAGNGLEELPLVSSVQYCPNFPGSIVTTPANFTYADAGDVSGTLAPSVEELSGSSVSFSLGTPPATGRLRLWANGQFTYQWGAASFVSFEVNVRNSAGLEEVLPVTLKRPMSAATVLTPSATEVTQGDPVSIAARIEATDTALLPTGTVTFTGEGDGQSWAEDLGPDGVASVDIEDLPVGAHTFTASYSGDSNYAPSVSEAVTVTVTAKEEPGIEEPECAEGEALNEAGECVTTGTEGEGGEGGDPDGGVKPEPLPDTDKQPVVLDPDKHKNTVPAPIANTGAESSAWLAGVSALIIAAGVSLVARRRNS